MDVKGNSSRRQDKRYHVKRDVLVRCSNHYTTGPDGKQITSSLEYEGQLHFWVLTAVFNDFDDMARMVRLCDEMGIDTIDAGTLVAINMEVGKLPGAMPRLL